MKADSHNKSSISKVCIIINPSAGKQPRHFWLVRRLLGIKERKVRFKSPEALSEKIIDVFNQHKIDATAKFSKEKGHAKQLAKEALNSGVDAIIAVGGDGTINEITNAVANTDIILGVIPHGTANVFGLAFDIPNDIEAACLKIINGKKRKVDLGRLNGIYFSCMAGIGFDAFVIKRADRSLKKLWGALSYIIVATWEIFRYRFHPILFTVDNTYTQKKGFFLIISNTKYYGGENIVAPTADPTDGKLEVCIFSGKGVLKTLWYGVQIKLGNIDQLKDVEIKKCSSLRIRSFGRHNIHVDAEYIGKTPAKISVAKKALTIPY